MHRIRIRKAINGAATWRGQLKCSSLGVRTLVQRPGHVAVDHVTDERSDVRCGGDLPARGREREGHEHAQQPHVTCMQNATDFSGEKAHKAYQQWNAC